MSRCFPFPPPGYEKKTTTDDLDLLKKEKQKERHKKEKKDKEKREGKEKKDKDKSDGKHKEKKDKKEKNRDKKKEKDRDRGKDKSSSLDDKSLPGHSEVHDREKISTEKRFPGQSESHNGERVSNDKRSAGRSEGHNGERVSSEKRLPLQSESRSGEKIVPKEEKDKLRNSFSNERRSAGKFADCNGGKVSRSIPLAENAQDSNFAQELDRRVREESRGTTNHFVDKFAGFDQKRDEGILNPVGKATVNGAGGNEKKDKRGDDRKIEGQGIIGDTRFSGNSMVEGIARPLETNMERKMEGKERSKEKGDEDKRRDKRKDRDKEKKSKGKDKDRDKERKKEEKKKAKEKKENKTMELNQVKESIKNDIIGTHDVKAICLSEESNKNAASEENLRKRKEPESNGFLHDNVSRPNKLPRPTLSSHSLSKNGRILDPCQTLIPSNSDRQGAATNLKVDSNKDQKVNGAIEAEPASVTKPPPGAAQADPVAEASKIPPPHPDSKYLSQILSVPKIEDLPDIDEQDWLFSNSDSLSKKCKLKSSRDDETPMVWSEAVQIASADVYALPYVLPY